MTATPRRRENACHAARTRPGRTRPRCWGHAARHPHGTVVAEAMSIDLIALMDAAAGASVMAVGLLAWRRHRASAVLALAAAAAWYAGWLVPSLVLVHRPLLLGSLLTLASRRLRGVVAPALLLVSSVGAFLPVAVQPWVAICTAVLCVAAAVRMGDRGLVANSPEVVAARRGLMIMSAGLLLPVVERLAWPRYDDVGLPLATYLCAVLLCCLIVIRGLLATLGAEADVVIELSERTPAEALADLRAIEHQKASPRRRRAVRTAVMLLEENARLQDALSARIEDVRASRVRLIDAAETERRRLEWVLARGAVRGLDDLEDCLRATRAYAVADPRVCECLTEVARTREDLDQIARGLHPRLLEERGLSAALEELSRRSPLPLDVRVPARRFPARTEQALWYACAEAVANVWKHSAAGSARVRVVEVGGSVCATIEDDGVGGAGLTPTGGLSGLVDRLSDVDGRLELTSTRQGTTVDITVPAS